MLPGEVGHLAWKSKHRIQPSGGDLLTYSASPGMETLSIFFFNLHLSAVSKIYAPLNFL